LISPLINLETLAERVIKQLKFEEFMVGAKCLWENLVGGTTKALKKFKNERESQLQEELLIQK
jgi:hypothetical protein